MPQKILVVEDNPQSMRLVQMVLQPHGYVVLGAGDGEEALRLVESDKPDLVIMDVHLPGIDGLEVTRRLRRVTAFRDIPIVAMTAYAMKGDEETVLAAGCNAYLSKPINTRELPGLVARMLQKHGKGDA